MRAKPISSRAGPSRKWDKLLSLPSSELTSRLISRDREMVRLRNSSPFYLAEGVDFGDYGSRIRLRRAAIDFFVFNHVSISEMAGKFRQGCTRKSPPCACG